MNVSLIAENFIDAFLTKDSNTNLLSAKIYFDNHMLKQKTLGFYGFASAEDQKVAYSYCIPMLNDDPIDIPKYEQMAKDIEEAVRGCKLPIWNCVLGAAILDNRKILKGKF